MTQRFLLIGDVAGAEAYHVGDEGMLEANLEHLRELVPGAQFTVISGDPDWTAKTYDTAAIEPIGFPAADVDPAVPEKRFETLIEAALSETIPTGFDRGRQAQVVLDAIQEADAVVISGGGNLNSTWPEHLYERLALLALAERLDTPAVVLGQTLGPQLSEVQKQRLVECLQAVRLIGVRESASYQLLEKLGVPTELVEFQLDDAVLLGRNFVPKAPRAELQRPYLALTLCGEIEGMNSLAAQVESLAEAMEADIVFVPHAGEPDQDRDVGARFGEALQAKTRFHLLEVLPAREVAAITGAAEMVVSTRYHPLVFAAAAGVPSLGLSVDLYTRQKLTGALAHAGLKSWVMPIELGVGGLLQSAGDELWQRRNELRGHLAEQLPRWEAMHARHWQRVVGVLGLGGEAAHEFAGSSPTEVSEIEPRGDWYRAVAVYTQVVDRQQAGRRQAKRHAEELVQVLDARDTEIASMKPILKRYEKEIASMRQALDKMQRDVDRREKETRSLQKTLRARDEELDSLKPTLAAREEELTSLKRVLEARDKELNSLRPALAAREEELAYLQPTLEAREEELSSVKPILVVKEEELDSIRPVLAAREMELAETKKGLVDLRAELEKTHGALGRTEAMLEAYRTSLVGRLARRLGKLPEAHEEEKA